MMGDGCYDGLHAGGEAGGREEAAGEEAQTVHERAGSPQ